MQDVEDSLSFFWSSDLAYLEEGYFQAGMILPEDAGNIQTAQSFHTFWLSLQCRLFKRTIVNSHFYFTCMLSNVPSSTCKLRKRFIKCVRTHGIGGAFTQLAEVAVGGNIMPPTLLCARSTYFEHVDVPLPERTTKACSTRSSSRPTNEEPEQESHTKKPQRKGHNAKKEGHKHQQATMPL